MTGEPQNLHSLLLEAIRHLEHKLRCHAGAPDEASRRAILGPQQASYLSRYLSDLITSAGSAPFLPGEIKCTVPMPAKSALPPTCPDCCAINILQGRNSAGGYCDGCASARHRVYEEPERIVASACVIMSTGQWFFGKRHCDCFAAMPVEIDRVVRAGAEQGFLTSRDRFVSREEAAYIALQSEQLKGKLISPDSWLTSEDLW